MKREGGERNAFWNGPCWLGTGIRLSVPQLSLSRLFQSYLELVGRMGKLEARTGTRVRLATLGVLPTLVVAE
jgi:hypothetical protein